MVEIDDEGRAEQRQPERERWTVIFDAAAVAGFCLVTVGLALVYFPLAPISAGLGLICFGFWGAKRCS